MAKRSISGMAVSRSPRDQILASLKAEELPEQNISALFPGRDPSCRFAREKIFSEELVRSTSALTPYEASLKDGSATERGSVFPVHWDSR